jgi:transposase
LQEYNVSVFFIPTYTPEIAVIELFFGQLKKLYIAKESGEALDLHSKEAINILKE